MNSENHADESREHPAPADPIGEHECIQARFETLSRRERQTLELVTAGLTNTAIADKLHLSMVTVQLHRGHMMRKMQAESLADLEKMWETITPNDAGGNCSR